MAETATSSSSAYPPRGLKPILCVAKSATPRVFLSLSEAHTMWVMQALPQDVAALACTPLNRRLRFCPLLPMFRYL